MTSDLPFSKISSMEQLNRQARILIVDDVPENRTLLERILSQNGYQVGTADDGEAALRSARTFLPDIILLDVHMPVMDGYQVCELLKESDTIRDIPVLFISALDATEDKVRGFQAGGEDYISKPFQVEEVLARIDSHLSIRRLREQAQNANRELAARVEELTETQRLLHERESKLNAFIRALPNLSFVIDENGRQVEIMAQESYLLPTRIEKMKDRLIRDVYPIDVASALMDAVSWVIETGEIQVIEYQIKVVTGEKHWFEGRIAPMEKNRDGCNQVVLIVTEISDRVKAYRDVQRQATQDSLTECFNRRHFVELANAEFGRAIRYRRPLALMILDVDHFKEYNDRHGHPEGDQLLLSLVDGLRQSLRSIDILGRYGGDEFIILMPETNEIEAAKVASRLLESTAGMGKVSGQASSPITLSVGIAAVGDDLGAGHSIEALIKRADEALYKAKADGRNCFRIHGHS
ncbi:MAG: diguanylate cyclase [Anaerolineales bacterium]|nr:diguanylate cyclase [Anaerolineales bacterium]